MKKLNNKLKFSEYEKLREEIIKGISDYFYKKSYIYACWLGGSDANNESDKYSDIDIFLCVDDLEVDNIFKEIRNILSNIGKLDFISNINDEGDQKIQFFHIEGTPESLIIDIGVVKKSNIMIFEEEHPYFKPKIIFNKDNIIKFKSINKEELKNKIQKFIEEQKNLVGQKARIKTYINRGNYIESTNYYLKFIFLPLVGILRVKYTPYLYNWGRIHISRHFSDDIVIKLENLMKFQSINDIDKNLDICNKWFLELLSEIENEGINFNLKK